jgi:hypothetical protein
MSRVVHQKRNAFLHLLEQAFRLRGLRFVILLAILK